MTKNTERLVTGILAAILIVVFFVIGREGANTTIDNAQATASALQNTVNELLDRPDVPDLSDELALVEGQLYAAQTKVAELSATEFVATSTVPPIPPTATLVPPTATEQFCYPSNLIEVVATRDPRVNLWESTGENLAGKMIMGIYEDDNGKRIQYTVGTTFFVYEDAIVTDGGDIFYEVFGPLGKGLYVSERHIKLFDATPDLYTCTD